MNILTFTRLIKPDLKRMSQIIEDTLKSDVPLINQIGNHIIQSGGKRLRPTLLLLSANACQSNTTAYQNKIAIAACIIELIHTATLLHDDVVDHSNLRRGKPTANHVFGNPEAVLTGDYLYSRAFELMVSLDQTEIFKQFAQTTNLISKGEVMQLSNIGKVSLSETEYLEVIYRKTASLFECATRVGAIVTQSDASIIHNMAHFGRDLGMGFQIIDDLLDYTGNATEMGKNMGDDLREGKMTLPLIRLFEKSPDPKHMKLLEKIKKTHLTDEDINAVYETLQESDAFDYTYQTAKKYILRSQQHLMTLQDSRYKQALVEATEMTLKRLK